MPEPTVPVPPSDAADIAQKMIQQMVDEHPGLATPDRQGGRFNDYAPVNLPNDPTAQNYLSMGMPATPAEPVVQPEATPADPAQPTQPPDGGLIFGKYKSLDEANKGYWNTVDRVRQLEAEKRALEAVNQHLDRVLPTSRVARPEPTPPSNIPVQFLQDQTPVIPGTDVARIAAEVANASAREQVAAMLQPLQQMGTAQQRLAAEYPDFAGKQAELASWMALNPDYQERVARDPEGGLELAWLRYNAESRQRASAQSVQATNSGQQQVNAARQAASAVTSNAGVGRRQTDAQARATELSRLYEHGRKTGDWKPYRQYRLEEAVGSEYINVLNQTSWGR